MDWLSYIPGKSTLLVLFKAARVRLMASSDNVGALADARITSATEEINRISDDIRDAKAAASSGRLATESLSAFDHPDSEAQPTAAVEPPPKTLAKIPDKTVKGKGATFTAINRSTDDGGVQWAGEYDALAGRREKGAFVSQLATLGYSPHEFRVTVRRIPPEGPGDTRQRYTVLVMQVMHGLPVREKRYEGGHGAEWVNEFSRDAAVSFPRKVDAAPAPGAPRAPA